MLKYFECQMMNWYLKIIFKLDLIKLHLFTFINVILGNLKQSKLAEIVLLAGFGNFDPYSIQYG